MSLLFDTYSYNAQSIKDIANFLITSIFETSCALPDLHASYEALIVKKNDIFNPLWRELGLQIRTMRIEPFSN